MKELVELRKQTQKLIDEQFGNQLKFSKFSGISQGSLSLFLSGVRGLSGGAVEKLRKIIEENNYATNENIAIKRTTEYAPLELVKNDNVMTVNVCAISGAGGEIHFDDLQSTSQISILKQYYHPNLLVVKIDGDSMEPTIQKGSHVGIVPFDGNLVEGNIYIVKSNVFGLTCKRVKASPEGGILLTSDNKNHADIPLNLEEKEKSIWGRVVWVMQNL